MNGDRADQQRRGGAKEEERVRRASSEGGGEQEQGGTARDGNAASRVQATGGLSDLSQSSAAGTPHSSSRWFTLVTRARGDQAHLMLGEHIVPQSEVIRAIMMEDGPCCCVD